MQSILILVVVVALVSNVLSFKSQLEDFNMKKVVEVLNENRVAPGTFIENTVELSRGQKRGFLQFWYYFNLDCDIITEIDTIHLHRCLPWWHVNAATNFVYLTANATKDATDGIKKYVVTQRYYTDNKCTESSYQDEISTFEIKTCHNGYFVQIEDSAPKPTAPGLAFTQFVTKKACKDNNIEETAELKWLPFDECLYNGNADYMYTSCNSTNLDGEVLSSRDASCTGNVESTFSYTEADRCDLVADKYTNFMCL
jgi:hypothetical protein